MAVRKSIITFGLVSVPVELHVAARSQTLDLDLLHASDKTPIKYRLYCPKHEREVERKEVVKGYKLNGGYVILDDEDFEKAERAASRAIEVVRFVAADEVDPLYLERSYYVTPQSDSERPYQVLLEAMQRTEKLAVVTFVMSNRQQYAVLRPAGDKLALHTIYYGDEVREVEADWRAGRAKPEEVRFAEQLIEALTGKFTPREYHDEYRDKLMAVIRAKAAGKEIELPEARKPPAKVVSLTDALRQSLEAVRKPAAAARRPAKRRRARKAA